MADAIEGLMRGVRLVVFDFDGVFTDNFVYTDQNGVETLRFWRGDGVGLAKLRKLGVEAMVLSTEANPIVSARCKKLQIPCLQGTSDKFLSLGAVLAEKGLGWNQVSFVGNDVNDLGCLEKCALPIVVADAHPDVRRAAKYTTRAAGGHGAVREVCDLFESAFSAKSAIF